MGWGHFSTVWMCRDNHSPAKSPKYVAMKIQKSAEHYREAAFDEIELLRCASKASQSETARKESGGMGSGVVALIDHFEHHGPNGNHVCMVFEMLGENLLKVIKNYDYRGISIPVVRNMALQMCKGLDFLHRHCHIIHTDLKPENVLIATPPPPPSDLFIKSLIDQQSRKPDKKKKPGKGKKTKGTVTAKEKESSGGHAEPKSGGHAHSHAHDHAHAVATVAHCNSQDTDGSEDVLGLSNEQKKKIKKKMKKKQQRARKGDKAARRKTGAAAAPTQPLSAIDELREMELMEQASQPIMYAVSTDPADGAQEVGGNREDSGLISMSTVSTDATELSLDEDVTEDDLDGLDITASSQVSLRSLSPPLSDVGFVSSLLRPMSSMPWLRHSLFGAVNFRSRHGVEDLDSADRKAPAVAAAPTEPTPPPQLLLKLTAVPQETWSYPSSSTWAVLHMVCMHVVEIHIFNSSCFFQVLPATVVWKQFSKLPNQTPLPPFDLETAAYYEWFGALTLNEAAANSSPEYISQRNRIMNALDPESLQFYVKGRGLDTNGISNAVGRCLIQPVSSGYDEMDDDDESYSPLVTAGTVADHQLPVLWTIGHSALVTEFLVAALEQMFPGLHFLCQCDAEDLPSTTEDINLWGMTEALCQHPYTDEDDGSYSRALIGIDVASVTQSLYPHGYAQPPEKWYAEVCPLQLRLRAFAGEAEDVLFEYQSEVNHKDRLALEESDEVDPQSEEFRNISDKAVEELDEKYVNARLKIVDLGNACWTHRHFTDDIQTRQYRSPEVILGANYDTSADMWSLACIIFELLTGDLLFDPHSGKTWDRDEDHLAMIAELVGGFPRKMTSLGKRCQQYFNKKGEFRNIKQLKFWPLRNVLREKYLFSDADAVEIASFLETILEVCHLLFSVI
jgi:serine/threonine protein kinase